MLYQDDLVETYFGAEYTFSDVIHCYGRPCFREVEDQPSEQIFVFKGRVYEIASTSDSDVIIAWQVSNHLKCLITNCCLKTLLLCSNHDLQLAFLVVQQLSM